jgi:LAO/AO transport system kinase
MSDLLTSLASGDTRTLAKVITSVENRTADSRAMLRRLYPLSGKARVVGITGSPGSGKSTLADHLAADYATTEHRVAVVAVDPSSPYTGGALLGDRIRMSGLERIPGIYIRSMATRGHLGGLASTTADVVTVLDAAGRDPILVETVGVGQDEIDIVRLADISVVVLVPGMGDEVQTLKAGIMEIGDIFVINKCDHPGTVQMERALTAMLALGSSDHAAQQPAIIKTVATDNAGIRDLREAIDKAHAASGAAPKQQQRRRSAVRTRLTTMLQERLVQSALEHVFSNGEFDRLVDAIVRRERDPYSVVEEIIETVRFGRIT